MRRQLVQPMRGFALACAGALLLSCGSLQDPPTAPAPTPEPVAVAPPAVPNPSATPIFGTPTTPSPSPSPGTGENPQPEPTPGGGSGSGGGSCPQPVPPGLGMISVKVHQRGNDAWILDSTPLVTDREYCAKIGFTDGRSFCPVRPEGHPDREQCELYLVGRAKDTARPGPTWYGVGGGFCQGRSSASGCENHPDNQYQAIVYKGGTFRACAQNGVCGEVVADK